MSDSDRPTRADLERALRHSNMQITALEERTVRLEARVGALVDMLNERGGLEQPVLDARSTTALTSIQMSESDEPELMIRLGELADKYGEESPPVPCEELIPICHARCCTMTFPLTTQDLNQGVVRWDYARPYHILQRDEDGYCVHSHPDTHGCTIYTERPRICRRYDCRKDPRIWHDYERRIPADEVPEGEKPRERYMRTPEELRDHLLRKVRVREIAVQWETQAVTDMYDDRLNNPRWGNVERGRKP